MNLFIFDASELSGEARAWISGRRHDHLRKILKLGPGDELRAGLISQSLGTARVLRVEAHRTLLAYAPDPKHLAPEPINCRLIIALPRPPVLRRVLQSATTLGFKEIYLIHSARVEKSYWQSPELDETRMSRQLRLGLEQCMDIYPPGLYLFRSFRPFAEDVLPGLQTDRATYLADPRGVAPCPRLGSTSCNLMIGPEGGWTPFELELLETLGVKMVELGSRILRVETAVPYMTGRLELSPKAR